MVLASDDRGDIGKRVEKSLDRHLFFDGIQQMFEADAGEEDGDVDFARDDSIGEIDRFTILLNRHFSHRRRHEGLTTVAFDEPLHIFAPAAFQASHAKPRETGW